LIFSKIIKELHINNKNLKLIGNKTNIFIRINNHSNQNQIMNSKINLDLEKVHLHFQILKYLWWSVLTKKEETMHLMGNTFQWISNFKSIWWKNLIPTRLLTNLIKLKKIKIKTKLFHKAKWKFWAQIKILQKNIKILTLQIV
jgi:hypothetical protein